MVVMELARVVVMMICWGYFVYILYAKWRASYARIYADESVFSVQLNTKVSASGLTISTTSGM